MHYMKSFCLNCSEVCRSIVILLEIKFINTQNTQTGFIHI
jgi:hypothetical protein